MRRLLTIATVAALAACSGQSDDPAAADGQSARDSSDQMMIGLKQYMTNLGVRQAYLESDSAFIYESNGRVDLVNVSVTFYTTSGEQTSVLTSREGTYNMRTGLMEARGDVLVVRNDGGRLRTSLLQYDQSQNQVRTDSAYSYDSADRHVTGRGFTSDPSFTNLTSTGLKGTAGRFTLPGQ